MTVAQNSAPQRRGKPFKPGQSGNPGGRPKELVEVQDLARQHTKAAIERLAEWMASDNPRASTAAAQALLDRAWGKPMQPVEGSGGLVVQVISGLPRAPDDPR